jgi:hypothetical protein
MGTGLVWLRMGQVGSSCEFGIEPSGSIKCWETIQTTRDLSSSAQLHGVGWLVLVTKEVCPDSETQ